MFGNRLLLQAAKWEKIRILEATLLCQTYMARDQREIIEKRRPIDGLMLGFQLEDERSDGTLDVHQAIEHRIDGCVHLFLLALHFDGEFFFVQFARRQRIHRKIAHSSWTLELCVDCKQ